MVHKVTYSVDKIHKSSQSICIKDWGRKAGWHGKEHFGWSVVIFLGMAYLENAIGREVYSCGARWSKSQGNLSSLLVCLAPRPYGDSQVSHRIRLKLCEGCSLCICKRTYSIYSPIAKGSGLWSCQVWGSHNFSQRIKRVWKLLPSSEWQNRVALDAHWQHAF